MLIKRTFFSLVLSSALFALTACEPTRIPPIEVPRVVMNRPPPPSSADAMPEEEPPRTTRITSGPGVPQQVTPRLQGPVTGSRGPAGQPITASFDQMPLAAFINTVFGELLKVNFQMDPSVASRQDLVTLRTGGARSPLELLNVTREVLSSYGLQVLVSDDVYRIVPNEVMMQQIPSLVRSRALPDVPLDLRPMFLYVQFNEAKASEIVGPLSSIYGQKIKIQLMAPLNGMLVFGLPQDVEAVVRAAATMDQGAFSNSRSIRIDPVYWNAQPLAAKLVEILKAQGYNASLPGQQGDASIFVIPVPQVNSVLVFSASQKVIDQAAAWASQLDQPSGAEDNQRVFIYFVRNTKAMGIAEVVGNAIDGLQSANRQSASGGTGPIGGQTPSLAQGSAATPAGSSFGTGAGTGGSQQSSGQSGSSRAGRLVVDEVRNALVFSGSAAEWARYRPLIEQLDVPTREVLIEVSVLEVRLTDNASLGVQWLFSGGIDGNPFTIGSMVPGSELAQQAGGLNIRVFNSAGALRGALTALATNNRVNVLSNPRLLARSGAEAKIQIGQDVPTVSSQGQSTTGQSPVLQSIQYRQTGVLLSVKPIIHAGRRVDLEVSQEVSTLDSTAQVAGIQSPGFSNRKVTTQLALFDGATVILGGLISESRSLNDSGIPFLKDIPLIGQAFRTNSDTRDRTELIVLITPYIISSSDDIQAITDAYTKHLEDFGSHQKSNLPLLPQYYRN